MIIIIHNIVPSPHSRYVKNIIINFNKPYFIIDIIIILIHDSLRYSYLVKYLESRADAKAVSKISKSSSKTHFIFAAISQMSIEDILLAFQGQFLTSWTRFRPFILKKILALLASPDFCVLLEIVWTFSLFSGR